jgi:hypothetical protein
MPAFCCRTSATSSEVPRLRQWAISRASSAEPRPRPSRFERTSSASSAVASADVCVAADRQHFSPAAAIGPDDDQRQPFRIVDAQQVIKQGGRDAAKAAKETHPQILRINGRKKFLHQRAILGVRLCSVASIQFSIRTCGRNVTMPVADVVPNLPNQILIPVGFQSYPETYSAPRVLA